MSVFLRGTGMGTMILAAAVVGGLLLFTATGILVCLNWNAKIVGQVLSIVLVGTAATLAAVASQLKTSRVESTLVTSVVIDTVDGAPPLVIPKAVNDPKVTSRLSELFSLGRPVVNENGVAVRTVPKPDTEGKRFTFCGELLQYRVFKVIEKMQRGGKKFGQTLGVATAAVSVPMKISKIQDYPGKSFLSVIAVNRFSNRQMEQFNWEHGHVPLPRHTNVSLLHVESSQTTGVEKFIVRLHKPRFFTIDFVVEPLGSTGLGILPGGLTLDPALAAQCETYQLQVTMQATFEWITAGSEESQEYKDWASWLFSGLREQLS
jgi:hypothetical protein